MRANLVPFVSTSRADNSVSMLDSNDEAQRMLRGLASRGWQERVVMATCRYARPPQSPGISPLRPARPRCIAQGQPSLQGADATATRLSIRSSSCRSVAWQMACVDGFSGGYRTVTRHPQEESMSIDPSLRRNRVSSPMSPIIRQFSSAPIPPLREPSSSDCSRSTHGHWVRELG